MRAAIILAAIYLSSSLCLTAEPDLSGCEVAAKTEQGYVCGRIRKATNGDDYASFRGIPYAKQPLGELRFKELQPAEPYDGIFDAKESGPICLQIKKDSTCLEENATIAEDCLRINIHVPGRFMPNLRGLAKNNTLLPVFFLIHGGGFLMSSGNADVYGPEYLVTKEVILVTFDYRLNILGFLSLDNKYIPGNNGLRDAITALKWVQRNIKSFGGDPDKVTIGGPSAGGAMVHLLSISPATKGLFKQVVAMSGNALVGFYSASKTYAKLCAGAFLTHAGINPLQSPKAIHDELVAMPVERLLHIINKFLIPFSPVIETPQPQFTTVLPKDPEELLAEGAGKEYPMIVSFCNDELGIFRTFAKQYHLKNLVRHVTELIVPLPLLFKANVLNVHTLTKMQLREYFNITNLTLSNGLTALTDSYFKYPAQRVVLKRLAAGAADTYMYQFSYSSKKNFLQICENVTYPGAAHFDDNTYFFRMNHYLGPVTVNELAHTSNDNRMRDWMTTLISNFVKYGKPVEKESCWPPSQADLKVQNILKPFQCNFTSLESMKEKLKYFTKLYKIGVGN